MSWYDGSKFRIGDIVAFRKAYSKFFTEDEVTIDGYGEAYEYYFTLDNNKKYYFPGTIIIKKEEKMDACKVSCRGLFEIRAIAIETDEVVYKAEIVAEGEKEALFESDLKEVLKSKRMSRYDVDIVVREFGRLPERAPRRKNFFTGKKGKREE